jgi:hypothetical protein
VTGRGDKIQDALAGSGSGGELKNRLGQREAEQTAASCSWRSRPAAHRGPADRLRHSHASSRELSLTVGRRQVRGHYSEDEGTRYESAQHAWTLTAAGPPGQAPTRLAWVRMLEPASRGKATLPGWVWLETLAKEASPRGASSS